MRASRTSSLIFHVLIALPKDLISRVCLFSSESQILKNSRNEAAGMSSAFLSILDMAALPIGIGKTPFLSISKSNSEIFNRLTLEYTLDGSHVTSLDSLFDKSMAALILALNTLASLIILERLLILRGSCRFSVLDAITTSSFTISSIKDWEERYYSS